VGGYELDSSGTEQGPGATLRKRIRFVEVKLLTFLASKQMYIRRRLLALATVPHGKYLPYTPNKKPGRHEGLGVMAKRNSVVVCNRKWNLGRPVRGY
jgi:hypothetical protein